MGGFVGVDLVATSSHKQNTALRPLKNDALGDLVQGAAHGVSRLLGGARFSGHLDGVCVDIGVQKDARDTFQAFAHGGIGPVDVGRRKGKSPDMTFLSRLTRAPRAYAPDIAADCLAQLPVPAEARALVAGAAGCSPFLSRLMLREAAWLESVWDTPPEVTLDAVLDRVAHLPLVDVGTGLRQAKRQVALLTGLADLGGVWQGLEVTQALTRLADTATHRALTACAEAEIKRGKLPGATADDIATAGGMVALAMGKMGAGELNYSSDIDLICLFDETRFDPADYGEARQSFVRITRRAMALLSEATGDGYVFRTDLRLRPDPSVTPVCLSMEAAERYYEALGRTWERAAHIKARSAAGDVAAGEAYLTRLRPFVYRRHLDFAAIQDAHDIRLKLRHAKRVGGPLVLEGHNVKLGLGGIREIEFFTQTRQLIAGGRDPSLQKRGTLEALGALQSAGWIPEETQTTLSDAYLWLRDVEHRLQMVQDAQTHSLPQTAEDFDRLAAFMDMDVADLRTRLTQTFNTVETCTSAFFAPSSPAPEVADLPFSDEALAQVDRWATYPALRSERGRELFTRLRPKLLLSLGRAAKPDEALFSFDGFLRGLPSGVQVFSLFAANPQLIDLIVDICATAPDLARYLSRNAKVLDAVIGGDFFAPLPDRAALRVALSEALSAAGDYEGQLDIARRWQQEAHFRIGVHMLRGTIDTAEAGTRYADLAEAVVQALWPAVVAEFEAKHGTLPGQGAAVIAMGSLGARRLTARSDLDLIVIYDAPPDVESTGPRSLPPRSYFARLTQALITAMTAPTGAGRLYEVDMRLRPSGKQGPVATALSSFDAYQRTEAWVWEHLALTRARVIVGAPELSQTLEAIRSEVLAQSRFGADDVAAALVDMRARFIAAGRVGHASATKSGPGRMQEIELIGQANALIAGRPVRSTSGQLAVRGGFCDAEDQAELARIYAQLSQYQQALRLLTADDPDPETLGIGGQSFLLTLTGHKALTDLKTSLHDAPARADRIITKMLAKSCVQDT